MLDLLSTSSRRKLLFAMLYFCEGAPIGFIWWMLPTRLRQEGFPVDQITAMTSLLILPWALKFLWAPIVDTVQSPRWNFKHWIITSQIVMVVALLPLMFLGGSGSYGYITVFLLIHSFAAATQDVAIDALCISFVPGHERGSMNGWMQVGMLSGRSLFGGVALTAAPFVSDQTILAAMALVIGMVTILFSFIHVPVSTEDRPSFSDTMRIVRDMSLRRSTFAGLLFAVFGGIAYEGTAIVAGPFLVDRGLSGHSIGFFFSFFSVGAMMTGALTGGKLFDRIGARNSVRSATMLTVCSVLVIAAADQFFDGEKTGILLAAMTMLYFSIGVFTSCTYALFMEVTDPRLGATQFSTFMGGTNLCESIAGFTAGTLITHIGYPAAFSVLAVLSFITIPLLSKMRYSSQKTSD